uniref:Caspase family p20 domain-containing protein n=1 Tax=Ciona savignyi TaxID=51511 RepID=H2YT45_CIOSA
MGESPPLQVNENNNTGPRVAIDAHGAGEAQQIFSLGDATKEASSKVEYYQMNRAKRGMAIIINNENFHYTTRMNKRSGTDVDARNLNRICLKLGFDVQVYKDLKCIDLLQVVDNVARKDHTGSDCCFFAFLSHGDDGVVYGTDGIVQIKVIVDQFRGDTCPTLVGKPKIFMFQACRGTDHEVSVAPHHDVVDGASDEEEDHVIAVDAAPKLTLPSGSDFLFCYSVAEVTTLTETHCTARGTSRTSQLQWKNWCLGKANRKTR